MLTPNLTNECNSTLTSGTRGIYPHCYTLMLMSGVTGYEFATRDDVECIFPSSQNELLEMPSLTLIS